MNSNVDCSSSLCMFVEFVLFSVEISEQKVQEGSILCSLKVSKIILNKGGLIKHYVGITTSSTY